VQPRTLQRHCGRARGTFTRRLFNSSSAVSSGAAFSLIAPIRIAALRRSSESMPREFESRFCLVRPVCLILLLAISAATSRADDSAILTDVIHSYANNPGDSLIIHVHHAPDFSFRPEIFTRHRNIAFDIVHASSVSPEINSQATPKYHGITTCVVNLNELSSSECKAWSSVWSQPLWDPESHRPSQRGICSIVILVSSGLIREAECSALPRIHLKKISTAKNGCINDTPGSSSCRLPVFDISTHHVPEGADPRLESTLREQLDLHARILGTGASPFPSDFSDLKKFFVGQEHILSELKDVLSLRKLEEGAKNSRVLVLVFAGVSGTGKTMLASLIANIIHGKSIDDLQREGKFFEQSMGNWANPEDSDALFGVKQASDHPPPAFIFDCCCEIFHVFSPFMLSRGSLARQSLSISLRRIPTLLSASTSFREHTKAIATRFSVLSNHTFKTKKLVAQSRQIALHSY
jgi:hypothetical protein